MKMESEESKSKIVSPEIKATEPAKSASPADKVGNGKVEMKDGRPHFAPGKAEDAKSAPRKICLSSTIWIHLPTSRNRQMMK